ncbi:MAG: helix-turn-helix transcriptional regulator [Microthrixaceae bacterium]
MAIERARSDAESHDRRAVADRVRAAIGASGLTAAQFAELVGTSGSRLSTYVSGKVTPSAAMLVRIERQGTYRTG